MSKREVVTSVAKNNVEDENLNKSEKVTIEVETEQPTTPPEEIIEEPVEEKEETSEPLPDNEIKSQSERPRNLFQRLIMPFLIGLIGIIICTIIIVFAKKGLIFSLLVLLYFFLVTAVILGHKLSKPEYEDVLKK